MRINYRRMISKEMYFHFFFFFYLYYYYFLSVIYVTQNTDLLKIFYHN